MKIEEFKTALRKLFDDQVEAMTTLVAKLALDLQSVETAVKAVPENDRELISLIIEAEFRRYAARLDKL